MWGCVSGTHPHIYPFLRLEVVFSVDSHSQEFIRTKLGGIYAKPDGPHPRADSISCH